MNPDRPRNIKMIRVLAVNTLKAYRSRFVISGMAIALTALLITGVFTMGLSLYETNNLQSLYRNGGRHHGLIHGIDANEMEKLTISGEFAEWGYLSLLLTNFSDLPLEMAYGSQNLPELTLTMITGRMPEKYTEVAMSTAVLDRLGVPHRLGETFTLSYNIEGTEKTAEFTVCGFWRENPDGSAMKSRVFVSEEFAKTQSLTDDIYFMVSFDKPNQIYDRIKEITEGFGIYAEYAVNPVYDERGSVYYVNDIIADMIPPLAFLLLLIIISAYLLIHNIFYIFVTRDISFYGFLRAVGATMKQIRRIVRIQALFLSLVGIPIGLILGYLLSLVVVPAVLSVGDFGVYHISTNPIIFVFAAVFAMITVMISVNKPSNIAGRISPVAAVRHVDADYKLKRKERKTTYGAKTFITAARNIFRSKRKLTLSIVSLSIGISLFCISTAFMSSFSLDLFLKFRMYGDLMISNQTHNSRTVNDSNTGITITPDFIEQIEALYGIDSVEELYYFKAEDLSNEYRPVSSHVYKDGILSETIYTSLVVEMYGLTGGWIDKLSDYIAEGEFDAEKFSLGGYCVISKSYKSILNADGEDVGTENIWFYKPGDKIRLDGIDSELTVMAIINSTSFSIIDKGSIFTDRYELYLPANMIFPIDKSEIINLAIFTDNPDLTYVNSELKTLINRKNGLIMKSVDTYIKEYNSQTSAMITITLSLSILLCMVGITNFINSSSTSIMARHYELSVLEAIGMTKTQIKRMLTLECLYTGGLSLILSFSLSYPLSGWIIGSMEKVNGFIIFSYSWTAVILWVVFICLASVSISFVSYRSISSKSLSTRLMTV